MGDQGIYEARDDGAEDQIGGEAHALSHRAGVYGGRGGCEGKVPHDGVDILATHEEKLRRPNQTARVALAPGQTPADRQEDARAARRIHDVFHHAAYRGTWGSEVVGVCQEMGLEKS